MWRVYRRHANVRRRHKTQDQTSTTCTFGDGRSTIGAEPGGMGGIDPTHFFPHKYSYPPHFINVTTHKFSYSKNFSFTEFKKRRQISNMYYVNIILLICFSDSCHRSSRSVNGELIPVYLVNFYFLVHPSYI